MNDRVIRLKMNGRVLYNQDSKERCKSDSMEEGNKRHVPVERTQRKQEVVRTDIYLFWEYAVKHK